VNPIDDLKNIYRDGVKAVDPAGLISSCIQKDGRQLTIHGGGAEIS